MNVPKISVVMAVYNGEKYLKHAINSILNQSFTDFEFIIINDGSKDDTDRIIKSYTDNRIVYVKQDNKGLSAALNRGIKEAKGEYIARMDDDDISCEERFALQYDIMQNHLDYVAIGTQATYITEDGEDIYSNELHYSTEQLHEGLPSRSPFVHSSVMMRTSAVRKVGGYKETGKFFYQEDLLLWIDLSREGNFYNINKPLVKFRITKSSNQQRSASYFEYQMKIVEEYWINNNLDLSGINSISQDWGEVSNETKEYNYYLKIGLLSFKYGNNKLAHKYLKKVLSYSRKSKKATIIYYLSKLPLNYSKIVSLIK